jgi:hypothetical protein
VYRDVLDLGGLNGTVMLGGITKSTPNFEGVCINLFTSLKTPKENNFINR